MIWHPELKARWPSLPLYQQILMVCNELNRAQNTMPDRRENRHAIERALELLDFTIAGLAAGSRLREFLRARECMAALYIAQRPAPTASLQRGLMQLNAEVWRRVGEGGSRQEKDQGKSKRVI